MMNSEGNTKMDIDCNGTTPVDQYADAVAASLPQFYCRTTAYKQWLSSVVNGRGYKTILDAACGNGIDSLQLLEEGYEVLSTDGSEPMVDQARMSREQRKTDAAFKNWVIEVANWLTLPEDLRRIDGVPETGFDVVLCLGNSFAHLPDFEGTKHNQKLTLTNLFTMVKPGGILILDHRNYDVILDTGSALVQNVYYTNNDCIASTNVTVTHANGLPVWITTEYKLTSSAVNSRGDKNKVAKASDGDGKQGFRLSSYPHRLADMNTLIEDVLGADAKHSIYGDFLPLGEVPSPSHYAHVIEKSISSAR